MIHLHPFLMVANGIKFIFTETSDKPAPFISKYLRLNDVTTR
ncbi:MAG: hypothetical protein NTX08_05465 [Sphingobacteriales bacterium]|nr:hypothetical protein [Sphingobacteriales bacterium]